MNTRESKTEDRDGKARSVLECGSPLPLSNAEEDSDALQSARELAQSKTCRSAMLAAFCFLLLHSSFILHAQSYAIDWFTIDGGGGVSTGGVYTVSGTIGQPDAGQMSGGNYTVNGGFWGIIAAVQTPGAPTLAVLRTTTNTVVVAWPSPSTGWALQQNTNSVNSVNWSNIISGIQDDGTIKSFLVNPPTGNRFYRLNKP